MKITNQIEMLEINIPQGNRTMTIYPTLLWDAAHLVLIDAGLPGSGPIIKEAIEKLGFKIENLTEILLTHQDIDHIGGAKELLAFAPKARIYAHEIDAPFIDGAKVPTKLHALEQRKDELSTAELPFYQMLKDGFALFHNFQSILCFEMAILLISAEESRPFSPLGIHQGTPVFISVQAKLWL